MMIVLIIIAAYILNVFLNRWLNKLAYKYDGASIIPFFWFIPVLTTVMFIFALIIMCLTKLITLPNWFTGQNWKK